MGAGRLHAEHPRRARRRPGRPNGAAWILSSGAVDAAGRPVSVLPAACASAAASTGDPTQCPASHGIGVGVTYQAASRFWRLRWTETGIYLALVLGLAGFCYWRLGRRLP